MKLMAREDIEAPISMVWEIISNFEVFELAATRRGAKVRRRPDSSAIAWDVSFPFRGKPRDVEIRIDQMTQPALLSLLVQGKAVNAQSRIELTELGPRRTRMTVTTEMRPVTLAARLFIQSLKLARTRLNNRYQQGVRQLATLVEGRARSRNATS